MNSTLKEEGTYVHENSTFFPMDGQGWQDPGQDEGFVKTVKTQSVLGSICFRKHLHKSMNMRGV